MTKVQSSQSSIWGRDGRASGVCERPWARLQWIHGTCDPLNHNGTAGRPGKGIRAQATAPPGPDHVRTPGAPNSASAPRISVRGGPKRPREWKGPRKGAASRAGPRGNKSAPGTRDAGARRGCGPPPAAPQRERVQTHLDLRSVVQYVHDTANEPVDGEGVAVQLPGQAHDSLALQPSEHVPAVVHARGPQSRTLASGLGSAVRKRRGRCGQMGRGCDRRQRKRRNGTAQNSRGASEIGVSSVRPTETPVPSSAPDCPLWPHSFSAIRTSALKCLFALLSRYSALQHVLPQGRRLIARRGSCAILGSSPWLVTGRGPLGPWEFPTQPDHVQGGEAIGRRRACALEGLLRVVQVKLRIALCQPLAARGRRARRCSATTALRDALAKLPPAQEKGREQG